MKKKEVLVLAGTIQQFEQYRSRHQEAGVTYICVNRAEDVLGRSYTTEQVVVWGTFWERPGVEALYEFVKRYARNAYPIAEEGEEQP